MGWNRKSSAAAALLALLCFNFLNSRADGTIDNSGCESLPDGGLGQETCAPPNPFPGEGVLFTAAEQVVSIVSAIADEVGCPAVSFSDALPVSITPQFSLPQRATTQIGAATFTTVEVANTMHFEGPFEHNGVRRHDTLLETPGVVYSSLFGNGLTALQGSFITDGTYAVEHGDSFFTHSGVKLEDKLIKDFYLGLPTPPTFVAADEPNGPAVTCTEDDFNNGLCVVSDPGDFSPGSPFVVPQIIRDNGLGITAVVQLVPNIEGSGPPLLLIGHPKGKWRQTSFYRGPNGGKGRLVYTKVRIAPFDSPNCVLQLSGAVTGSISFPTFVGTVMVFPLGG